MKKYFYSLEKVVQLRQLSSWSRPCPFSSAIRCTKIKLAVLEEKFVLAVQKRLKVVQLPGWFCGGLKYPAFPFPFPRPFRLKRSVCQGRANIENVVERSLDWLEWFSFSVGTLEPPKSGARRPDNPPRVGRGGNIGKRSAFI